MTKYSLAFVSDILFLRDDIGIRYKKEIFWGKKTIVVGSDIKEVDGNCIDRVTTISSIPENDAIA